MAEEAAIIVSLVLLAANLKLPACPSKANKLGPIFDFLKMFSPKNLTKNGVFDSKHSCKK
jgi:hypothetical protein